MSSVTVVVLTRSRPRLLARALTSVCNQRDTAVDVSVVVDDCSQTSAFLAKTRFRHGAVRRIDWTVSNREPHERSGPRRVAQLRKAAIAAVRTPLCAFLDDDNEFEPDHLQSLMQVLSQSSASAAHSWRTLWSRNGRPYRLHGRHPWCRDPALSEELYRQYSKAGIYRAESNIVADQVIPYDRERSMVDTSEWLFETDCVRTLGFDCTFDREDWVSSRTEDSKLLGRVVALGLKVPSTNRPTLRYYLGGYSNNWTADAAALEGWL